MWIQPGAAPEVLADIEARLDDAGVGEVTFVDEEGALAALRASGALDDDGPVAPGQVPTFFEADAVPAATIEELRTVPGVLEVVDSAITAEAIAAERAQLDQLEADLGG